MQAETLPNRTRAVLIWIADQYMVNFHHIQMVLNHHPETVKPLGFRGVKSLFRRLQERGLVEWKRLLPDRPSFVYLTRQGLAALELPYPVYEPRITRRGADGIQQGTTNLHKDYINHLRLYLEQQHGAQLGWLSERRLRLDTEPEADGSYPHRADALVYLAGKNTAIEVEKTKKGERRLERIMLTLMNRYDQTCYFCTNPGTYGLARRVAGDIDPEGRHFQIVDWSQIA